MNDFFLFFFNSLTRWWHGHGCDAKNDGSGCLFFLMSPQKKLFTFCQNQMGGGGMGGMGDMGMGDMPDMGDEADSDDDALPDLEDNSENVD